MAERQSELRSSATTGDNASSEQIRRDIHRTRADMDETVDAIGERLRPRHLLDDLIDVFRGGRPSSGGESSTMSGARESASLAKDLGASAMQKLKHHPMPAALIGAGIAWLLFDESSGPSRDDVRGRWRDEELREHGGSYVDARTGQPYDDSYGAEYKRGGQRSGGDGPGMMSKAADAAKSAGEKIAGVASSAASSVADAASSVTGAASSAGRTASDYAGRAGGAASQYGRRARDFSGHAYGSASDRMRRGADVGRESFERSLNEHPLAVVAAAMAGGMLAGMLFPNTRRENQLMGEQSDALKESVKEHVKETKDTLVEKGKEAADATKDVANAAASAAADEADKKGIDPGSLAEKVKHVARDTAGAAKESARREGLTDVAQKGKDVAKRAKEVAKDEARQHKDRIAPGQQP